MIITTPTVWNVGFSIIKTANAISSANTITIPSAASVGQVAVLYDYVYDPGASFGTPVALVTPTGFTSLIADYNDNQPNESGGAVSWKILTASDPGSTISGSYCDDTHRKVMIVIGANDGTAITSVTSVGWDSNHVDGDPASIASVPTGIDTPAAFFGGVGTYNTTVDFTTESPAFDEIINSPSTVFLKAGYKLYNSGAPTTHTIDKADEGFYNWLSGGWLAFS